MTNNDEEEKEQKSALVDQLVDFLRKDGELFHDGEDGYVALERKTRREIYRIHSKEFRNYVSHVAWEQLEKALSKTARDSILGTLEAIAKFEGEERKLSLRTAWHDNALWYDLGDWRAVKITKKGWEIIERPPILFKKFHRSDQCEPIDGGDINDVLQFLNLDKDERYEQFKILLLTYLPTVLLPDIPRPILILHGLQGSAKSTASKVIKDLIDPSDPQLLVMPQKQQEFTQVVSHYYGAFFDNLSRLSEEQSDALCRASTGDGLVKRQLYTDDDDIVYRYRRVICLNGISIVASKPDLLDRALIFELRRLSEEERLDEATFWERFNEVKPKLLGAMFTVISKAMAIAGTEEDVRLTKKPRMADYALWASRVGTVIGYKAEDFINAYEGNVDVQNEEALENSAVAQAIMELARTIRETLTLSTEDMFARLKNCAEDLGFERDRDFPISPRWLWKRIKIVQPNLLGIGIDVRYHNKRRPREIEIRIVKSNDLNGGDGKEPEKLNF
jgi:hypothetical protein